MSDELNDSRIEIDSFSSAQTITRDSLLDYIQSDFNGQYYDVPINLNDLYTVYRSSVFHASALELKANILLTTLLPNKYISNTDFLHLALNFLIFGNGFVERIDSATGKLLRLKNSPAKRTRRAKGDNYVFLNQYGTDPHKFKQGGVFHLIQPDINQEIYGLPSYMASVTSSKLNQESTMFRLNYYLNGSHAGYIIYLTDPSYNDDDVKTLKQQLKSSKGGGAFKNLFLRAPDGKPEGLKLIPVADVAAKDEFVNIKEISREDELGMHRVPPQIMGIVPKNSGGFGAVDSAAKVFARNEIEVLQSRFLEMNDWLGEEVIKFKDYIISGVADDKQSKKK